MKENRSDQDDIGILYTICIPKNYFHEYGYLYELETPFDTSDENKIINLMQSEVEMHQVYPKVKLLAYKLDPIFTPTFCFPAISDAFYLKIKQEIATLVQEICELEVKMTPRFKP